MLLPGPGGGPAADQLERGEPPLFAVHGGADTTVPVTLRDALVARARGKGVRAEYHRVPGGRHGYAPSGFFTRPVAGERTAFERLLRFARRALRCVAFGRGSEGQGDATDRARAVSS